MEHDCETVWNVGTDMHEGVLENSLSKFETDEAIDQPVRILEHKSGRTTINALDDQLGMLDYWAHAGPPIRTGFNAHDGKGQIGY
jgi:hypothetical protein